ncbi:MAG TPA: hypothetical protein VFF68_11945 [Anaerolineaceae bacterium]|nr:hypothetical protein [Anaerolineaceae bacterium]
MAKSFGKYAIVDPVTHHFEREPAWWWKIKPPTSGDELNLSRFTFQNRLVTGPDGVRREYPPTNTEIMHREVALTFGGTNLPADIDAPVEEGGEPVLKVGLAVEQIEATLREMPHEMVLEIWAAVGQAVPGWGPAVPFGKKNIPAPETESQTPSAS